MTSTSNSFDRSMVTISLLQNLERISERFLKGQSCTDVLQNWLTWTTSSYDFGNIRVELRVLSTVSIIWRICDRTTSAMFIFHSTIYFFFVYWTLQFAQISCLHRNMCLKKWYSKITYYLNPWIFLRLKADKKCTKSPNYWKLWTFDTTCKSADTIDRLLSNTNSSCWRVLKRNNQKLRENAPLCKWWK